MHRDTILIIDDEADIRAELRDILAENGFQTLQAGSAEEARACVTDSKKVDLALLDIWMPGEDGMSLLRRWKREGGVNFPILVMSGHGTISTALEATRLGAWHFLEKPFSIDSLLLYVSRALEMSHLRQQNRTLARDSAVTLQLIGNSPSIRKLREQINALSSDDHPVLILGESGCELQAVAHLLHCASPRHQQLFVRAGNPDLSKRLLEAASDTEPSLLQQAHQGTLFLNPLSRLTLAAQKRLLSVLDNGHLLQSDHTATPVDVRLITTLWQTPEEAIEEDTLDPALYARLKPHTLVLPPLRERAEDVPALIEHYMEYYCSQEGLTVRHFPATTMDMLRHYSWPDNVQELRRLVYRLLIDGESDKVSVAEISRLTLPPSQSPTHEQLDTVLHLPYRESRARFEQMYYQFHIEHGGAHNIKLLSRITGMDRTYLYRKLENLGIKLPKDEPPRG